MADREVQVFAVRLWSENLGRGRREWRGQVRHVPSGETRYFREWEALAEFLDEMLPRFDEG